MSNQSPLLSGAAGAVLVAALLGLQACASGAPQTPPQLAVASASIAAAEKSGAGEAAPTELSSARTKLSAAQSAAQAGDNGTAARLAEEANADAKLADAKAHEASAEKALAAVQQANQALRNGLSAHEAQ